MAVYCVSYDLIDDKKYEKLFEKIKSYGYYAHAQESLWFVKTSKTAEELRDELRAVVDKDDKIIVIKVVLPWASLNLPKEVNDWLNQVDF